ncbi:MAG: ATP-dependent Clp protease ATP-binding subunit [Alloprevotella sp.]|nr:ATP-dependent Clp protease ATP-binding subunit [Bacteroidales bacterium]MDY5768743.1 ATP-dependent Clp protease ATP-binding subunit [Alloprevotella sp.]
MTQPKHHSFLSSTPLGNFDFDEEEPGAPRGENAQSSSSAEKTTTRIAEKSQTPIIDKFCTDLTSLAEQGALDPVVGRQTEMLRVMQILCRRKKNNPVLIGDPGVGKTAVVEGIAQLIATKNVPVPLENKRIVTLNMATLVAGTQFRGQFEERVRKLMEEVKKHKEIIVFIDEIHTIIGAGSAPGSLDAANMLKPALARGEMQCIGATSTAEYKKSIEKDAALERRFQKILLSPASQEETLAILKQLRSRYEQHHNTTYTDEALQACVSLTARYINGRVLPDKAIDAMDEAGAKARIRFREMPSEFTDIQNEISKLTEEKLQAAKSQDYERAAQLRDVIQQRSAQLQEMRMQWEEQQKKSPVRVDENDVAETVSMMSGVPVTKVRESDTERLKNIGAVLRERIVGQDDAVEQVSRALVRNRLGLSGGDRPIGTFLFVGPTGVGKTYLVKCLAEQLFGSKDALIRVDMSEYGEKFSVSRLVGAPPGYVGYEEGGQLTDRVRRKPYSVVLLDEIEKAHPDVFNTLLQVMDEGRLTDGNGVTADFRNTLVVMTSNSGTRQLREVGAGMGFDRNRDEIAPEKARSVIMNALKKQFAPEFLNRLDDIIVFNPLNKENASQITDLELKELLDRVKKMGYALKITDNAKQFILSKGFDAQYGARSLKRAVRQYVEDPLCDFLLEGDTQNNDKLVLDLNDEKMTVKAGA